MNTVIRQIKRCFTIYSALLITLFTTRVRAMHNHNCGHEQLIECAKPLSIITESGLTFVSSKNDLDKICPDLKEALKCMHAYTRMCMHLHDRKHFKQLFHGTSTMVHELCDNSTYQQEYLKFAPCMKQIADEKEVCFARFSRAMKSIQSKQPASSMASQDDVLLEEREDVRPVDLVEYQKKKKRELVEGIKNVCCTFKEYMQCSTHTTQRACGEEAADFSRNFLDRMSSSMTDIHCSEYDAIECGLTSGAGSPFAAHWSYASLAIGATASMRYVFS